MLNQNNQYHSGKSEIFTLSRFKNIKFLDINSKYPEFKNDIIRWNYLKFILIFSLIFTILQISDIILTENALKNPEIKELNPLYKYQWFIYVKLLMVFLISFIMIKVSKNYYNLAKKTMLSLIIFYVFVNLNNLYFNLIR